MKCIDYLFTDTKLEKLEAKLTSCNHDIVDFNDLLNKGVKNLLKLDYVYETEDTEKKREIISSMYPEKMTFDGFSLRTNRINESSKANIQYGRGFYRK